ncbi:MAG: SDR family oxidoreductase [Dehalococcoidia bacterium]|nr:SDR family oxidoreductase [Dehalococcoidia bacterium]
MPTPATAPTRTSGQRVCEDLSGAPRLGVTTDVAPAVTFLASDAASWVTGQVLVINGGYSMHG